MRRTAVKYIYVNIILIVLVITIRATSNMTQVTIFKTTAYKLYIFPPAVMSVMPIEKLGLKPRKLNFETTYY
jgi:hypothetical protein